MDQQSTTMPHTSSNPASSQTILIQEKPVFPCEHCDRVLQSKVGGTNHMNKCLKSSLVKEIIEENQNVKEAAPLTSNDNLNDVRNQWKNKLIPKPPDPPSRLNLIPKNYQYPADEVRDRECGIIIPIYSSLNVKCSDLTPSKTDEQTLPKKNIKFQ